MIKHIAAAIKYFAYVMIGVMCLDYGESLTEGIYLFILTYGALHFAYLLEDV